MIPFWIGLDELFFEMFCDCTEEVVLDCMPPDDPVRGGRGCYPPP